mgnify:CR=1 FL=1
MMRNYMALIAFMSVHPISAQAQPVTVQCVFDIECYEDEACDGTGLSLQLSAGAALRRG